MSAHLRRSRFDPLLLLVLAAFLVVAIPPRPVGADPRDDAACTVARESVAAVLAGYLARHFRTAPAEPPAWDDLMAWGYFAEPPTCPVDGRVYEIIAGARDDARFGRNPRRLRVRCVRHRATSAAEVLIGSEPPYRPDARYATCVHEMARLANRGDLMRVENRVCPTLEMVLDSFPTRDQPACPSGGRYDLRPDPIAEPLVYDVSRTHGVFQDRPVRVGCTMHGWLVPDANRAPRFAPGSDHPGVESIPVPERHRRERGR